MTLYMHIADDVTANLWSKDYEEAVLDDTYRNYDSRLVAEDLEPASVRDYLEAHIHTSGWVGSYNYDAEGITTFMLSRVENVKGVAVMKEGFAVIRNLEGSYDIHSFWYEEK